MSRNDATNPAIPLLDTHMFGLHLVYYRPYLVHEVESCHLNAKLYMQTRHPSRTDPTATLYEPEDCYTFADGWPMCQRREKSSREALKPRQYDDPHMRSASARCNAMM